MKKTDVFVRIGSKRILETVRSILREYEQPIWEMGFIYKKRDRIDCLICDKDDNDWFLTFSDSGSVLKRKEITLEDLKLLLLKDSIEK